MFFHTDIANTCTVVETGLITLKTNRWSAALGHCTTWHCLTCLNMRCSAVDLLCKTNRYVWFVPGKQLLQITQTVHCPKLINNNCAFLLFLLLLLSLFNAHYHTQYKTHPSSFNVPHFQKKKTHHCFYLHFTKRANFFFF